VVAPPAVAASASRRGSAGRGRAASSQQDASEPAWPAAAVDAQQDPAAPEDGAATTPDSNAATAPDDGAVTTPDGGVVTTSDDDAVTTSDSGAATVPDDGSVTTPDDGAVTTPDDPAVTQPDSSTATAAPPDRILIEIDPNISAGFINQRYDLEIRGWVVATSPVEEVTLCLGDTVVSRMQYGAPGPTARVALLDGTPVTRHVYTLTLPRPRSEAGGPCTISITARTTSGQTRTETYQLAVNPLVPTQVRIESGPTRPIAGYGGELAPVVLFIERAALDASGYLLLVGWVVSLGTVVAIQVFAGEERISAPKLEQRRDDVGTVFPAYPNALHAGFTLATALTETAQRATTLRAQAISADGFMLEVVVPLEMVALLAPPQEAPLAGVMAPPSQDQGVHVAADVAGAAAGLVAPSSSPPAGSTRPAEQRPRDPRRVINYFCDIATLSADGDVTVSGWAVCAIGIANIEAWLGDQRLGEAELGLARDDVGEEYRSIPLARYSGFRFVTQVPQPADGEHRLRVVLRNGLDDVQEDVSVHVIDRPKPAPVVEPPAPETPDGESPTSAQEFRLEIDSPSLVNGAMIDPVTGRLTIEGWILSRSGVTGMQVWLDDQRLGDAHHGLARQDVGNAFPDWPNSLRSGYAFHCPPRSLRNGEHVVKITVRASNGAEMERSFRIDVRKPEGSDDAGTIRRRMPLVEIDVLTEALAKLDHHPAFRLVLRQNGPIEPVGLGRTFASLGNQAYRDWRLTVLAEDSESAAVVRGGLAEQPGAIADRVTVIDASAADTQLDLPFGAGEAGDGKLLFGLLCPGDEFGCDALIEIALASAQSPGSEFLYADELRISPTSREREPFCKPDFSPDLLLSTNYIGRPWFATPDLLARAEVAPRALLRDAEYDIVLRCTEQASAIRHVAKLLCRRGGATLDSPSADRAALRRAATRRGIRAEVQDTTIPGTFRFRRTARATGKVSIIIPTCAAHGHIETCVRTLRDQTAYRNFEIVCVDNIPPHQVGWKRWLRDNADKVVDMPEAFNWSRFNNRAVEASDGEYLLFLNDDVEIISAGWLDALLEHAQRPEVGIVGAQLQYPGGKVQHAGMFLATIGIARHAFRFATIDEPGYFGLALTQRNVIAVTGACLLVRREVFNAVGGYDEAHEIINNDLDFCLRAHRAGLLTVYTPYSQLIHHELASRDRMDDVFDTSHFVQQWKTVFAAGDPYFSPLLSRHADDYRPDDEPVEGVFAGHPLFRRDDIKRILVVKLDHIGDFITALPAMRRLKQHFPMATIQVLAARGARAFAESESCIDGLIEFEFFHARSGLGQKELTDEDYAALHARLKPYGFDLAIDLRKHPDTREALKHVPARFLAGYDYMGQFTFLDISLEWEGDKNLHRKRGHVTDDLINLVEAVGTAASADRNSLMSPTWPAVALPEFLDASTRALFAKPVVAIHPGVGTVMRQWPAEHFAALVDLLTEAEGVNAVLVGGPDEVDLVQEVLDKIVRRDAVVSVAGKTSLAELTELLACCALYVGNNSGPKHIAAAIGVPTIGVHSGVIDPTEWAPIGKRAMALRRNMTCSPCYLARLEDCPRNLACLRQLEPSSVWQACRAMLATSQVPIYFVPVPVEAVVEAAGEAASESVVPAAEGKSRAGRKRARAAAATPSAEPAAPVEAPVPGEAPIEPGAEDASVAPVATIVEDSVVTPDALAAEAPRAGRKRRGGGKTGAAGVELVAAVEAPVLQAVPPEVPSEPVAEGAAVVASVSVADVPRGDPEPDAAETAPVSAEPAPVTDEIAPVTAEPAVAVEIVAPELPSEAPTADATDVPRADEDREAAETALSDPTSAVEVEAPVQPEAAAVSPEAAVEPPDEVAAVTPGAPDSGTPRTGQKRAAASANRPSRPRHS
jgi:ADP-heptose:LPS heptosyltransferase/GT2 family glycosyltransferase